VVPKIFITDFPKEKKRKERSSFLSAVQVTNSTVNSFRNNNSRAEGREREQSGEQWVREIE
jgi:hypothetical protein